MASRAGRRNPFLPQASEDAIDLALLETIPEVADPEVIVPPWEHPSGADALLQEIQAEAHAALDVEYARIREAMAAHVAELEARAREAEAALEQLREENAHLLRQKDAYERAFAALKDLTKDVEDEAYR